MSRIDIESKRKLREMGVATLVDALDAQDESLTLGMVFEERLKLAIDDAHAAYTHAKVAHRKRGCRAGLNPPVSSSDLAMVCRPRGYVDRLGECPGGAGVNG